MTSAFAGLDPCVHCGFCLSACPTYEVTGDESDSPRGRIVLMQALARGDLPADDAALQEHLDRCLGCRGCESVCPSGVIFGPALEASREIIAHRARPLPAVLKAALWVLARPARQRVLWALARMLRWSGLPRLLARGAGLSSPTIARAMGMLAATSAGPARGRPLHAQWARGRPPEPASLFLGCVQNGLFGHVHDATIRTCRMNGIALDEVRGQVCCGALAAHAGDGGMALELARANVAAFGGAALVVTNSAGCGAMLKSYGALLGTDEARAFSTRVRDVSEVLAERGPLGGTRAVNVRVAYDAPCHLLHAQRVAAPPLRVLAAVRGAELVPLAGTDRCCGSAGLYALIEPDMSDRVLRRKLDAIRDARADVIATGNPGCIMQIGAGVLLDGQPVRVMHPVELLAMSYED